MVPPGLIDLIIVSGGVLWMDEEFEEFVVESLMGEEQEIDPTYEFDAPRFWDFSQPETFLDAAEAEQWFESAGSYPPSRKHSTNTMFSVSDQTSSCGMQNNL